MMRYVWLGRVGLVAIALGLGCGNDEVTDTNFDTRNDMGKRNGEPCLWTGAGARACAGRVCMNYSAMEIAVGMCSETCGVSCRFGGSCVADERFSPPMRYCLEPCDSIGDCSSGYACLQTEGIRICDESSCEDGSEATFCTPLPTAPLPQPNPT
jgi:hypothetical protein